MYDKITISQIVAVSLNGVIGKDNTLPWHLPLDLKFFKEKTNHSIIIMGKKTFESLGRVLPNRYHIVLSSKENDFIHERVCFVNSLSKALEKAQEKTKDYKKEVFIIGGSELFKSSLIITDKIYLTRVYITLKGDTFYPVLYLNDFTLTSFELIKDQEITLAFNLYEKKDLFKLTTLI